MEFNQIYEAYNGPFTDRISKKMQCILNTLNVKKKHNIGH